MNEKSGSDYINRTCECFARAFEQYHAMNIHGDDVVKIAGKYIEHGDHVNKDVFNNKIKPLIEQFFKENDKMLKAAVNEFGQLEMFSMD